MHTPIASLRIPRSRPRTSQKTFAEPPRQGHPWGPVRTDQTPITTAFIQANAARSGSVTREINPLPAESSSGEAFGPGFCRHRPLAGLAEFMLKRPGTIQGDRKPEGATATDGVASGSHQPIASKASMQARKRLVIVSEYYAPDPSTTSEIITTIASNLANGIPVLVLSGTAGSASGDIAGRPTVVEISKRQTAKSALLRRAISETLFALRTFFALLRILRAGDVVLTVTAPFMLPYAVAGAAKLKRAASILIMHDFYPDVLVLTGLLKPTSLSSRIIHLLNAAMFRLLSAVVIIGRETEALLKRYAAVTPDKVHYIPNWATLDAAVRPVTDAGKFRRSRNACFVVGLSGNLGFTHDPDVVFEAARLLQQDQRVHFLLSGWGIGFARLQRLQADAALANITLVERVASADLDGFLAAADAWIIPYRANVAGVSVPSRLYNLLAVGRPILIVSESNADAAQLIAAHDIGWVIAPGDAPGLAAAISQAASADGADRRRQRAAEVAGQFSLEAAMTRYRALVEGLLQCPR
jgi:colanic acid biosynthesis glycosyl transferase WcaI